MTTSGTREEILLAAEGLFARNGYASTSLRQITQTAGVNIAAVNYHFGSKKNLLVEVLDRIVGPLNESRLSRLDHLENDGIPDTEALLTAFLLPDLELIEELRSRDSELPRFVSRMYSEASELMTQLIGRQFAETQKRFYAAFGRALPQLSEDEIAWRLHCVVGIVLYLFSSIQSPGKPPFLTGDRERDLRRLLEVTVPMMTAPSREVIDSQI